MIMVTTNYVPARLKGVSFKDILKQKEDLRHDVHVTHAVMLSSYCTIAGAVASTKCST